MSDESKELRLRDGATEWLEQDGEVVVLDLHRSWYVGLNEAAGLLWSDLARGTTRDRLIDHLVREYELDHVRAETDVDTFIAACSDRGLLD